MNGMAAIPKISLISQSDVNIFFCSFLQVIIVLTTQRLNDSLFELFAPYRLRKTFGASISVSPSILSLALSPHWIRKSRVRYTRSSALHGHASTELEQ